AQHRQAVRGRRTTRARDKKPHSGPDHTGQSTSSRPGARPDRASEASPGPCGAAWRRVRGNSGHGTRQRTRLKRNSEGGTSPGITGCDIIGPTAMGGPIHLRARRRSQNRRRNGKWRLAATGGIFGLVIGAACLAPTALAPTALAPSSGMDEDTATASSVAAVSAPAIPAVAVVAPRAAVVVIPTPTPRLLAPPTAVVVSTLSPSGLVVLSSITSDRTASWVKNHTETPLRSGPSDDA